MKIKVKCRKVGLQVISVYIKREVLKPYPKYFYMDFDTESITIRENERGAVNI